MGSRRCGTCRPVFPRCARQRIALETVDHALRKIVLRIFKHDHLRVDRHQLKRRLRLFRQLRKKCDTVLGRLNPHELIFDDAIAAGGE